MKKYISLLLSVILLVSLSISAGAESDKWNFSEDYTSITDGQITYNRYALPAGIEFNAESVIVKADEIEHKFGETDIVMSPDNNSIVFSVDYYSLELFDVYTTDEAIGNLELFKNGVYSAVRIRSLEDYSYYDISAEWLNEIAGDLTKKVDVVELSYADCYEILGFDKTDCLAYICGAVYRYDDELYFVDYSNLDNSYFTSDGHFSYRSGHVDMIRLDKNSEICSAINAIATDGYFRYADYSYEDDVFTGIGEDTSGVFFWIGIIFAGYVIPCVPFILGIVLPHTQKHGYTKRWYGLSVLSITWMILVTAILLILFL